MISLKIRENRLNKETSPYLLQHAHNPVDWYPWGEEAFKKARAENKPVFVSIGYSTCHWCHVMERESFEDQDTATILNDHFVAIKVDREERPDIDATYMSFVVSMNGNGGWPLNVFTMPDGKPFFGGTYFPPTRRYGMPAFKDLLLDIARKFREGQASIGESASKIARVLQNSMQKRWGEPVASVDLVPVDRFNDAFISSFDFENGGTNGAPKFPITLEIIFNFFQGKNVAESLFTLKNMACGGIFDHVGGGFHRYSVDERWLVPHFEKMLYDNALLLEALAQAYVITRDEFFKKKATKTYEYMMRSLFTERGFFSAQDADSDGDEGKFYLFTLAEIEAVTTNPRLFSRYYNVTRQGNFEGNGANILHVDFDTLSTFTSDEIASVDADVARLFEFRELRVHPGTDTKIIASWNGLAISALVQFGVSCNVPGALDVAARLGKRYLESVTARGGVLRIEGNDAIYGFLEDHAALMLAFVDLYEATFNDAFLAGARKICGIVLDQGYIDDAGHFKESGKDNEHMFAHDTRVHDSVLPSGASMFLLALFKLSRITGDGEKQVLLDRSLKAHYPAMLARPETMILMVQTLQASEGGFHVITVPKDMLSTGDLQSLRELPVFNKIIIINPDATTISVCNATTCKIANNVREASELVLRFAA